jgi:very-short-patch-repair endonuclease
MELHTQLNVSGSVHSPNEQWHHQNRDAYMIAQGLRVLRFKNEQVLNDTEKILDEIAGFLSSPRVEAAEEDL